MATSSLVVLIPERESATSTESDGYIFGFLPRPPESCYVFFSQRKFMNPVCLWFLHSLSTHNQSGTLLVDDVIALWNFLDAILVSREGELRLETLKRIIDYGIDIGLFDMLLEHLVIMFRRHMHLVSRECSNDGLILINHFYKIISFNLFLTPSVSCLEQLLHSIVGRLILLDGSHIFSDLLCADMLLLFSVAVRLNLLDDSYISGDWLCDNLLSSMPLKKSNMRHGFQGLPELIQQLVVSSAKCSLLLACFCHAKGKYLSSTRLVLYETLASSGYSQRQEELLPSRTNVLGALIHKAACDFAGQRLLHSSVSYTTFLSPCFIDFLEDFLRFEEVFSVCASTGCCCLDHVVRIPQELLLRQFLLHQLPRIWLFGWLKRFQQQTAILKWLQKQILLPVFIQEQSQDCGCPVLLQGLSREVDFIGQNFKASLGWFGSFLTFFYGSSPRPPDDRCALGVNFLKFTWSSQDLTVSSPRWKFLPS